MGIADRRVASCKRRLIRDRFSLEDLFSILGPPWNGSDMAQHHPRTFDTISFHAKSDGGCSQRPVESLFLPDLVCGSSPGTCRNDNLCENLVWLKNVLSLAISFRNHEKLFQGYFARTGRTVQAHFGP